MILLLKLSDIQIISSHLFLSIISEKMEKIEKIEKFLDFLEFKVKLNF